MKIVLLCLGKTNKKYVIDGLLEFEKRLSRFCKYERFELKDIKTSQSTDSLKELEKEKIFEFLKQGDFMVLLDEEGLKWSSRKFAKGIQDWQLAGYRRLVFVVAGAFGSSEELKTKANVMLSLSEMTYSHQLVRLIFVEQLYRAFAIINKHPYHND